MTASSKNDPVYEITISDSMDDCEAFADWINRNTAHTAKTDRIKGWPSVWRVGRGPVDPKERDRILYDLWIEFEKEGLW